MDRLNWDEYFMGITDQVGVRATCDRGKSGSIVVRDKKILTTGYVGSPPGLPHCDEVGHLIYKTIYPDGSESDHCVRTIHAEENALLQAAEFGIILRGGTQYCKMTPCFRCAMKIIRVGIVRVVAKNRYHTEQHSLDLFAKTKVEFKVMNDKVQKY